MPSHNKQDIQTSYESRHDHKHEVEEICSSCSGPTAPAHSNEYSCSDGHDNDDSCSSCGNDHSHDHGEIDWRVTILSGLIIAAGLIMEYLGVGGIAPRGLLLAVIFIEGHKPARNGLRALSKGVIGIDLLMTIAATGAVVIGEYAEGAMVLFLKDISVKLEVLASNRARHAIEALMDLRPEIALIRRNGGEVEVPVESVVPGEVFIVKPGDRIPLDGIVVDGETTVDQSMMTGESVPVHKSYLSDVFAGTINLDGVMSVKAIRASTESMLSNILRMVQEAEERKSPTETIVNRFARYYTPIIIIVAVLFALAPPLLFNASRVQSYYNALVLLVIGCPCALTIATPVAMVSAITSASRNGVLIKGSTFIEEVNKAKVFAFDKTGTLTQGKLKVTDVIPYSVSREVLLSVAATLEENSKHPIALAIKGLAIDEGIEIKEISEFKSQTGKGLIATIEGISYCIGNFRLFTENKITCPENKIEELEIQGKTTIMVARENEVIGIISLMDQRREEAKDTITELKRNGMKVEMLTGDNATTASAIAEQLGFNGYHANLLPRDKLHTIDELKEHGNVVMIGDGVNDAPALATADVGIAMGGLGSDIALETADIVLLEDNLRRLNYLQKLSRTTLNRIKENISISLGMKLVIVALAAVGTISLWQSVILGDVGLALLVIINSIRISNVKP
jgi:Cd2+/Zn2+-exporting ATPase